MLSLSQFRNTLFCKYALILLAHMQPNASSIVEVYGNNSLDKNKKSIILCYTVLLKCGHTKNTARAFFCLVLLTVDGIFVYAVDLRDSCSLQKKMQHD